LECRDFLFAHTEISDLFDSCSYDILRIRQLPGWGLKMPDQAGLSKSFLLLLSVPPEFRTDILPPNLDIN
jgi:hypothetical protein